MDKNAAFPHEYAGMPRFMQAGREREGENARGASMRDASRIYPEREAHSSGTRAVSMRNKSRAPGRQVLPAPGRFSASFRFPFSCKDFAIRLPGSKIRKTVRVFATKVSGGRKQCILERSRMQSVKMPGQRATAFQGAWSVHCGVKPPLAIRSPIPNQRLMSSRVPLKSHEGEYSSVGMW